MLTLTPELARRFDPLISLALPFFRGVKYSIIIRVGFYLVVTVPRYPG
jgi:hypothetical protein